MSRRYRYIILVVAMIPLFFWGALVGVDGIWALHNKREFDRCSQALDAAGIEHPRLADLDRHCEFTGYKAPMRDVCLDALVPPGGSCVQELLRTPMPPSGYLDIFDVACGRRAVAFCSTVFPHRIWWWL